MAEKPKRPVVKDQATQEYLDYLEKENERLQSELLKFTESDYVKTYVTIRNQIEKWSDQIEKNNIDLFADKEQKEFDRAFKFLSEVTSMYDSMDKLRDKMSPQQQNEVAKEKNMRTAEKYTIGA